MKQTDREKKQRGFFPLLLLWGKKRIRSFWRTFKNPHLQRLLLLIVASLAIAAFLSPPLHDIPPTYQMGIILGFIFLTFFLIASLYLFSTKNIRKVSPTQKDILFFIIVLVASLGMAKISAIIAEGLTRAFPGIPLSSYYYFFPVAAGAMLIRIVLNSEIALIYSLFASLLTGLLLNEGIFLPIFYLIGSIVGAHTVARCDQRFQLIKGGLFVGLTNLLLIFF